MYSIPIVVNIIHIWPPIGIESIEIAIKKHMDVLRSPAKNMSYLNNIYVNVVNLNVI